MIFTLIIFFFRLFGPTRDYAEDALKAALAYGDIVAAILDAMEAAQDALDAANKAHDYVSGSKPVGTATVGTVSTVRLCSWEKKNTHSIISYFSKEFI